jgi:hypothetical protein
MGVGHAVDDDVTLMQVLGGFLIGLRAVKLPGRR